MSNWKRPSAESLLAGHLRAELEHGRWSGRMPGVIRLARELGAARTTVEGALRVLEKEGLLSPQGYGRGRLITAAGSSPRSAGLRVAILTYEPMDRGTDIIVEIENELALAGHQIVYAPKSLTGLDMDIRRIARMVAGIEADAWLVVGGSGEVLEWFAARDKPAFALFGRRRGVRIANAGPNKPPVMAEVTRTLVELGHRRIVLMVRQMRRLPKPGAQEQAFLDTLAAHGIPPGPYHLPDWEESADGFHARLESLFRLTPPTAMILDEVPLFSAAQQFLAGKGLRVPGDVSLVSTDYDASFEWCRPEISHIRWDIHPVVRRVANWVKNVSLGRKDTRQTLTPAKFVRGGTIGRGG